MTEYFPYEAAVDAGGGEISAITGTERISRGPLAVRRKGKVVLKLACGVSRDDGDAAAMFR